MKPQLRNALIVGAVVAVPVTAHALADHDTQSMKVQEQGRVVSDANGAYSTIFTARVTNTGEAGIPGVMLKTPAQHLGGGADNETSTSGRAVRCGIGDTSSVRSFFKSGPPASIDGDVCRFVGGLQPGETATIVFSIQPALYDATPQAKKAAQQFAKAGVRVTVPPPAFEQRLH